MGLFHAILASERRLTSSQYLVVGCLATTRRSDNHKAVPNYGSIIKLEDLLKEGWRWLDVHLLALLHHCIPKDTTVDVRLLGGWEEIDDDVLEQRQIILQELRDVDVAESSKQELILVHVRVLALEDSGSVDDGTHSAHSVVVVILTGQLLRGQRKCRDPFV